MEWLNFIATELQKSFTPIFNPAYASCREEAKKTLLRQFDFVDRRLTGKSYVMGERFTVVDAYLFTISTWIEAAELSVDQWKALSAYQTVRTSCRLQGHDGRRTGLTCQEKMTVRSCSQARIGDQ